MSEPATATATGTAMRPASTDPAERHVAPDVTRAIALFGVILMNYHGYLILRGAPRRDGGLSVLLDPWTGVFSTRFAATFVLVAGIGITLMTRSAIGDAGRVRALRWRLASRGVVLYAFGIGFDLVWPGTILPFYGAMFALAALMFTLRTRWLVLVGLGAAVAAWALAWWRIERGLAGHDVSWLFDPGPGSVRGVVFDVTVNGTHPLLPWLAFLCAGMVVGRSLGRPLDTAYVVGTGLLLVGAAFIVRALTIDAATIPSTRVRVLFSTDPFDRGLVYTASALGAALVAFGVIGWLAERFRDRAAVDVFARAGQVALTIYVLHALVFNVAVDQLGLLGTGSALVALLAAIAVWTPLVVGAAEWQRAFRRGPFEQVYRSITR
ncbi:MAG: DUF418 domain-containing protein [Ilumatobacteraceae bacterium]